MLSAKGLSLFWNMSDDMRQVYGDYRICWKRKKETYLPLNLVIFRMSRTKIKIMLGSGNRDFPFYKKKGWFESDFFYQVKTRFGQKNPGNVL